MNRRSFIKLAASASAALILPACQSAPAIISTPTAEPRPTSSPTAALPTPEPAPVIIPGAVVWEMKSSSNSETYRVFVIAPKDQGETPSPVIYLTDGTGNFPMMIALCEQLISEKYMKPVIIVGIGYLQNEYSEFKYKRIRDFTNSMLPESAPEHREYVNGMGGAPAFLQFLHEELKPVIDSKYNTIPDDATLVGHSLGGLFALYALFQETSPFQRYIIGSPSIWWDGQSIFNDLTAFCSTHTDLPARVYISVGKKEDPTYMVSPMQRLAKSLESYTYPNLKLTQQVFEDETHLSVVPFFISRGLRAVYAEG